MTMKNHNIDHNLEKLLEREELEKLRITCELWKKDVCRGQKTVKNCENCTLGQKILGFNQ